MVDSGHSIETNRSIIRAENEILIGRKDCYEKDF